MWKECESCFILTGKCLYDGGGIKCVHREALRKILTEDLGMKSFSKFDDQKQQQQRLDVSSNLCHQLVKGNSFSGRVITGDESWYLQYNPEMKYQGKQCKTSMAQIPYKAHMP
jgi:hypothetical protein